MDPRDSLSGLHIPHPCPKRWGELEGGERKRFCSSCSLHVHDTALLTRAEARELLGDGAARVCLRIEYDASGSARFREGRWTHFRRSVLAAAAGLLAFCSSGGKSLALDHPTPSSSASVANEKHWVMGSPAPTGPKSQPGSKPKPEPKAKPKPKPKPKPKRGPPARKP